MIKCNGKKVKITSISRVTAGDSNGFAWTILPLYLICLQNAIEG